ncbi:MAG: response regulator transcription factor [Chloroflexaceae bacterium]|nr:response regulator transcription factor [Chloroflexaceae bacterium]
MQMISLFLIDANSTFLRIASGLLRESYGNEVQIMGMATNVHDALPQMRASQPQVILLGLSQQNLHDLESIEQIRTILPNTRIIVLGLLDMSSYRQSAQKAGAHAFVPKVALNTTLIHVIRQVTGLS